MDVHGLDGSTIQIPSEILESSRCNHCNKPDYIDVNKVADWVFDKLCEVSAEKVDPRRLGDVGSAKSGAAHNIKHTTAHINKHTAAQSIKHIAAQNIEHAPAQSIGHTAAQSIKYTATKCRKHSSTE